MEAVCGIRDIKLPICCRILFYKLIYSKNDQKKKKKNTSKEGKVK